jgi:hypothetical protein
VLMAVVGFIVVFVLVSLVFLPLVAHAAVLSRVLGGPGALSGRSLS